MKKLLMMLGTLAVGSVATTTVVACNSENTTKYGLEEGTVNAIKSLLGTAQKDIQGVNKDWTYNDFFLNPGSTNTTSIINDYFYSKLKNSISAEQLSLIIGTPEGNHWANKGISLVYVGKTSYWAADEKKQEVLKTFTSSDTFKVGTEDKSIGETTLNNIYLNTVHEFWPNDNAVNENPNFWQDHPNESLAIQFNSAGDVDLGDLNGTFWTFTFGPKGE